MDNKLVTLAKAYCKEGYSVIPVTSNKTPAIREWREFQTKPMTDDECEKHFKYAYGIALIGGVNNVTIIDFDLKYDFSDNLFEEYKQKIPMSILKKMYVQKTKNNGYHFIFKCSKVENNQKLAMRYTTSHERHKVYLENYNNIDTREKALGIATNHKTVVLIETRSNGGYALIAPTIGYEKVYGKIQEITEDEYDILMSVAREFSEIKEVKKDISQNRYDDWEITPFQDYFDRADIPHLLGMYGWSTVGKQHGRSIRYKRPGQTHSNSSALYDVDTKIFNVFSTSCNFDVGRGYSPVDVFCELECNGDYSLCYKSLIEKGYGKK